MVECETDNFVIEVQLFFSIPMAIYGGKDNWKSSVLQKLDTLVRFLWSVPNKKGRIMIMTDVAKIAQLEART